MRIIIAGSRSFDNYEKLESTMDDLVKDLSEVTILSGCARGADQLGIEWAIKRGYNVERYPADWQKHGKSAGILRNVEMADNANALVAFWDGESRGTLHMIGIAKRKGLHVHVENQTAQRKAEPF